MTFVSDSSEPFEASASAAFASASFAALSFSIAFFTSSIDIEFFASSLSSLSSSAISFSSSSLTLPSSSLSIKEKTLSSPISSISDQNSSDCFAISLKSSFVASFKLSIITASGRTSSPSADSVPSSVVTTCSVSEVSVPSTGVSSVPSSTGRACSVPPAASETDSPSDGADVAALVDESETFNPKDEKTFFKLSNEPLMPSIIPSQDNSSL